MTKDEPELAAPDDFGARVRAARAYKAWTRWELAKRIHMSPGFVKNVETGESTPTGVMLRGLVTVLSEQTGLPDHFFLGKFQQTSRLSEIEQRLERIDDALRRLSRGYMATETGDPELDRPDLTVREEALLDRLLQMMERAGLPGEQGRPSEPAPPELAGEPD